MRYSLALRMLACGGIICLSAATAWADAATDARVGAAPGEHGAQQARDVYERAARAYESKRYDEAIELFKQANRLAPNPAYSYNIGVAHHDKGEQELALSYFRDYLRQLPEAQDRPAVAQKIRQIEGELQSRGVQQVTVLTRPEAATISIDGQPVGISPWTGELAPGSHEVTAAQAGYEEARRSFDLPPDRSMDVQVTLVEQAQEVAASTPTGARTQPPRQSQPSEPEWYRDVRPVTWGVLGVGAISLGVSLWLEVSRIGTQDDAGSATDPVVRDSLLHTAESRRGWSDAFLLLGLGMSATGGVLIYSDITEATARRRSGWTGSCGPEGCRVGFGSSF